ncbi:hypothetical protein NUSPORA_02880 [Nucleospora cyclopteri]
MNQFEFESSDSTKRIKISNDEYDLELALALSKSLVKETLVVSPEEVKEMVDRKIKNMI